MTTASPAPAVGTVFVVVQAHAAPGQAQTARDLITRFVEPTRGEPGCLQYRLLADPADDDHLVLVEEWQDEAALQAHNGTPGYAELMGALMPLLAGEGSGMLLRSLA